MRDDDFDRELRNHLELEAEERREAGLSEPDARAAAARALGNRLHIHEDVRALSPRAAIDDLAQDLRYGLRMLRRQPTFTMVAALTLALGIGATTAVFSVVHAVLLRPLPYPQADRLVMVWEDVNLPRYKNRRNAVAAGNFDDWKNQGVEFDGLAAIGGRSWSLTGGREPMLVDGEAVTAGFFDVLQVQPALGRVFRPDEDTPGAARVAVLHHGFWTERFGADPNVVGQSIRLNDDLYTVIGVLPRGFDFPDPEDKLLVPLALSPAQIATHDGHSLQVVGRLKPGTSVERAQADLDRVARRVTEQYPRSNTGVGVRVVSLHDEMVGDVRTALLVLLGVVGFLLLMVCANIGSLLLSRASGRRREFAVRTALGAARGRLVRQLLTESTLLALAGAVVGLGLAMAGLTAVRALAPAGLPRVAAIELNATVALFNFVVALMAGMACGIAPALQSRRGALHDALKADTRGSAQPSGIRVRSLLIVLETALGVIVLVGAGLLLRSFVELGRVPLGFQPERVLTLRASIPASRYDTPDKRTVFYQQMLDQLSALPGAQSAAGISALPLSRTSRSTGVILEEGPPPAPGQSQLVDLRTVTPGYFSTMGIPLVRGRDVAWSDAPAAPPVIVISETMAKQLWPGQEAIGKRIRRGPPPAPWITVIGIVGNVHHADLVRQPRAVMYTAPAQDPRDVIGDWAVKTSGDPAASAASLRAAVSAVDPLLPITRVQPMERMRAASTAQEQFNLLLAGVFAVLALILAAVGLYGVTVYAVAQRTPELGIRLALGAQRADVLRLVLGQGARLVVAGLVFGTVAALALTRLMEGLLFGIGARDPLTFAGVAALLALVSLAACYIPARRAMRVDPVVALRL